MFRLTSLLKLDELYKTLPPEQGGPQEDIPTLPSSSLQLAQPPPPKLTIVGTEKGGFLLVAIHSPTTPHTYLNLLETKALIWTPLLTFENQHPDIVWASVNSDRSIAAFTLRIPSSQNTYSSKGTPNTNKPIVTGETLKVPDYWYESFAEAIGEGKRFPIHERTWIPQKVQFLFDVPNKQTIASQALITVSCEALIIYTITCARTAVQGGSHCLKGIKRDSQLVGPHIWSYLEQKLGRLYYVVPKPSKERSPPQQLLRTVHVSSRKAFLKQQINEQSFSSCISYPPNSTPLSQTTITSSSSSSTPFISQQQPIQSIGFPLPYTLGNGTKQISPLPCVQMVSLEGNATCLCIQHEFVIKDGLPELEIPITIVVFHLKLRIDFMVPLSNVTYELLKSMRIIFDSIADFLVIYVPGHHIHLFDIGELHNPTPGIIVSDLDATSLPTINLRNQPPPPPSQQQIPPSTSANLENSNQPQEVCVSALDLSSVSEMRAGPDVAGHAFLDLSSGTIYEYSFDRKRLLQMFETPNSELHIQLLHTACIHMEDMELMHQIIMHVLRQNPENAKVSLLKEFILGAAFQTLRPRIPYSILLGVPATIFDQELLQPALRRKTSLDDPFVSLINTIPGITQKGSSSTNKESYPLHHYWALLERCKTKMQQQQSQEVRPEDKDVVEYFKSLFGGSNSNIAGSSGHPFLRLDGDLSPRDLKSPKTPTSHFIDDEMTENVISVLAAVLIDGFPRESRASALGYAKEYAKCLNEQAEVLFTYIVQSFSEQQEDPKQRLLFFQALENMFCAVTELGGIPLPKGFQRKFALLSFECLSETLFLQYVERGVIKVTPEVIFELQERQLQESNPDFFYHLLCKLPETSAVAVLLKQPKPPMYLLEHFFSENPQLLISLKNLDLDTDCEDSSFIPLSMLLKSLQAQAQNQSQQGGCLEHGSVNALILPHALDFSFYEQYLHFQC